MEQVFNIKRSASSSVSANSKFSFSSNKSNIFAESYSFIWQPCVFINNFFVILNSLSITLIIKINSHIIKYHENKKRLQDNFYPTW